MADRNDTHQPYSRKITSAKSGAHMIAIANSMTSKKHPRSTSGDKMVAPQAKKWGKTTK